ncbi:phosphate ABC transporter ATP-binding protein PstB [Mycoplasma crocodyli]|uniref:Phosphate ABC transporter, ATP-binding protein PstB n=1 Tax=Mycoplasma crocodyli (strain ATCC 51981 / MP145) TaxID=512564 RepID=D5E5S5_MYCCM|nr:phosphate ABC transporter ATP-binding protein PstB [Mycoplasma crocodyli]ADE19451.1 phosphate ABC transporter, ATP-binding protein PstB [Mycoplasma crocodyli MP145]
MPKNIFKNKPTLLDKIKSKINFKNNKNNCGADEYKNHNGDYVFEIIDFKVAYKNKKELALKNINLNLRKGVVTSFIGPSGCGKSTMLKSLNKMLDLQDGVKIQGDIYYEGQNIRSQKIDDLKLRSNVGMIFQIPTPFPLSIRENISFPLKAQGFKDENIINQKVEATLKDVGLWDEVKDNLNKLGTELSGGQQQRLCIARAIALNPDVILMDEPTSALDPIATTKIENLILKLKNNYTIIIVTHSMTQAQRVSDETVFFYNGEIIEANKTKKIFTNPEHIKTKEYINGKIG